MVEIVLDMLNNRATIGEIKEAYPSLTNNHFKAVLQLSKKL